MQRGLLDSICSRAGARASTHRASDLVAFGAAGDRNAADLARDVGRVAKVLPDGPLGGQVLLVIRKDRYALAVAILAAWARGYIPVLPPELDRDAITTLASTAATVCVLHDTASGIPLQIAELLEQAGADAAPFDLAAALTGRACEARSYVRAADGSLVAAHWGGDWLGQASALVEPLGLAAGQRCVITVGSEHAHGVVLGVLSPLLAGAAFLRETLAPTALGAALADLRSDVLITVPAHVTGLLEGSAGASVARVVSALDVLPEQLAARGREALGGSWSDLAAQAPEVPILRCRAAERGLGGASAVREAEIERVLRARSDVRDVAAVTTPDGARVCVAVVRDRGNSDGPLPEGEGVELLELNRIRRDGIGRAQRAEILRQFGLRPDGSAVNFALRWGESSQHEQTGGVEQRTRVELPPDYGYFDGHFTGYPILPGAAQLSELVLPCVRRAWPELGALTQMARLKFTGRIQPGETIDVIVSARAGSGSVDFALKRGEVACSAGTLSFAPRTSEAAR